MCAQKPPTKYQATTRPVEFTVATLDKKGDPVGNLSEEDNTVLNNGRPREFAFFRYEGGFSPPVAVRPLAPKQFSNRVQSSGGPLRNMSALVLDSISTQMTGQTFVKVPAVRFLRALGPQTRVAILELGNLIRVLHDCADDMNSLRGQLRKSSVQLPARKSGDVGRMAREAED